MSELVLIRGLPGAGKSTYAKTHFPLYRHFEADMYFVNAAGVYEFNALQLNQAHRWCIEMVDDSIDRGRPTVVSNCFIQAWEFDPYFIIAAEYEVPVRIIELQTSHGNTHGVTPEKIIQMAARFNDINIIGIEWGSVFHIQREIVPPN